MSATTTISQPAGAKAEGNPMFGWTLPKRIRESRKARARLTVQSEAIATEVMQQAAIANHTADRVERAAVTLMERHKQALQDSADELHRK